MQLTVATCQFPVTADIGRNLKQIERQMREAQNRGAHLAHFSECCLSGYAGIEFESFVGYDWDLLARSTDRVMAVAREIGIWVILGSSHRLSAGNKPHNSLYVINNRGRIVDRYDKSFCTGDPTESTDDLSHYSPGDHLVFFTVRGIRCGLQICHDFRYQELYRAYKRLGVQAMFHSYHNGNSTREQIRARNNIWGKIVPPTMQTYAANNHMWISANNTSRRVSSWPSFFVTPDGIIAGRLASHQSGVLISTVNTLAKYYDASENWRDRAMQGVYHSGTLVTDPRSQQRTAV